MQITHNNKEYVLDAEKAIKLGVLKPRYIPRDGDVFATESENCRIVLVQEYHTKQFHCIGCDDAFKSYSNQPLDPNSDIMAIIEDWGYKYVGNMSELFKTTLYEFVKTNRP